MDAICIKHNFWSCKEGNIWDEGIGGRTRLEEVFGFTYLHDFFFFFKLGDVLVDIHDEEGTKEL